MAFGSSRSSRRSGRPSRRPRQRFDDRADGPRASRGAAGRGRGRAHRDVHDRRPAAGRLERMRPRFPTPTPRRFGHSHSRCTSSDSAAAFRSSTGSPTERRRPPGHTMGMCRAERGELRFDLVDLGASRPYGAVRARSRGAPRPAGGVVDLERLTWSLMAKRSASIRCSWWGVWLLESSPGHGARCRERGEARGALPSTVVILHDARLGGHLRLVLRVPPPARPRTATWLGCRASLSADDAPRRDAAMPSARSKPVRTTTPARLCGQ